MVYQAIHVLPGDPRPSRGVLWLPELRMYYENWGEPGDVGFIARAGDILAGAVWTRYYRGPIQGYGHVDPETPELTIALQPPFRGQGIGTILLHTLFRALQEKAVRQVSLSVSRGNEAKRLYERLGFRELAFDGNSFIMLKQLRPD